jgi:hypothetical protein
MMAADAAQHIPACMTSALRIHFGSVRRQSAANGSRPVLGATLLRRRHVEFLRNDSVATGTQRTACVLRHAFRVRDAAKIFLGAMTCV